MHLLAPLRRLVEAVLAAFAVVFGLMPDPTVPVRVERDPYRLRR